MCGVYPDADVKTAGEEISSTYEGRHVTLYESELTHPSHADDLVDKGDPVVFGTSALKAVGVAFKSAVAATDLIAIDTEGIWVQDVNAADDAGNSAVVPGDIIYINTSTCALSKISNQATQVPFGYALGSIDAGNTDTIAVKVHWSPSLDNAKRTYYTTPDGIYTYGKHHTSIFEGGQSTGLEYFDQQVGGEQDGHIYGLGSWVELQSDFDGGTGFLLVAGELGIYDAGGGNDISNTRIVLQQLQAILAATPGDLNVWRINTTEDVQALIAAANPGSVGYAAGAGTTSTKCGDIPIADIVGHGVVYVRCYDAAG